MSSDLFHLPDPLPLGAVFIGPEGWPDPGLVAQRDGQHFSDPAAAAAWILGQPPREGVPARLALIHQDAFAGQTGADQLVDWLRDLGDSPVPYLPILCHGNIGADQLVAFFRAGLFDALAVPISRADWVNMLIRAEKKLEKRQLSQFLLEETGHTQSLLRNLQREIEDQAREDTGQLLRAQESLEAANAQLSDAMAELSLLYKFGRELSQAANWDGVLRDLLESLSQFVGAGGAALVLRSAPGGSYSPRKTWHWEESSWDKVLVNLHDQVDEAVTESIMGPGVFSVKGSDPTEGRRIIALPLEYQEIRLGYLLLLFTSASSRESVKSRYLPFLQTVQIVLSEEVAGAQMLDRIRDIGAFNSRVLETISSAIWVVDEEGKTVFCNRSGQEMLTGQPSNIAVPQEFSFQIGRGRLQNLAEHYEELPELFLDARLRLDDETGVLLSALRHDHGGEFRGEGQVFSNTGEGIPVLVQTAGMPGRLHQETWLVVVAEDLRETRKLQAARLRSEQLESLVEMSATLAHEIRNPLMGLSAQAELLADQLGEDDPKSRYIQVITGEVERINSTITRMLNYVRPYEPCHDDTDLAYLCRDVLALAEPRAAAKQVRLDMNIPLAGSTVARLDGDQIKQVLLNLVINAVDAVENEGQVLVALDQVEGLVIEDQDRGVRRQTGGFILAVSDDGPGIPEADLERIFRPFFTTKNSGTGLGLSICHKIVGAHGGDIQVARENNRTIFRVMLPQSAGEAGLRQKQQEEG
jgi:two-component system nitrogen regulation sensor histidine kinase GlnL